MGICDTVCPKCKGESFKITVRDTDMGRCWLWMKCTNCGYGEGVSVMVDNYVEDKDQCMNEFLWWAHKEYLEENGLKPREDKL